MTTKNSKAKAEKAEKTTTATTKAAANPLHEGDDALAAAMEQALADLEEDDSHLQTFERVKLKKGQHVKGIFLGPATDAEGNVQIYQYEDKEDEGRIVDIKLWRIKTTEGIVDLMGDYALDDTFGGPTACAPMTPVKIECLGTESIEGSARQINKYKIGRGKPISA